MALNDIQSLRARGANHHRLISLAVFFGICVTTATAQDTRCAFDTSTFTYAGTAQEQAKCLLRPVNKFAHLGPRLLTLPAPLDSLIGQPVAIDKTKLTTLIASKHVKEADIGGALSAPLSPADASHPSVGRARYFIIHDTSSPNFLNAPFPLNINDGSAVLNRLEKFRTLPAEKVAHVFINRAGDSVTAVDFKNALARGNFGTKFARDTLKEQRKGLLLHVEMIQPRRREPSGGRLNDALAPDPGFPEAQLDRLALVYVAASVRRGEWMIPVFHAVMDITIPNGHDDPQHFDLALWAARLRLLLDELQH